MSLIELLGLMRKHLKLVIILPLVCAAATAAFAWLVLPNTYTASVSMYVLTSTSTENVGGLTNTELSASQMLTNDVAALIKSDRVERDTAESLSMSSLSGYSVRVDSQTTTRVVTLSVTGDSPQAVAIVANGLAKTTDAVAKEVMGVESVNVIDKAYEPTSPSGPPRTLYVTVSVLVGFMAAVAVVVLLDMLNTRVRSAEDAEELLGISVIGRIPVIRG